VGQTVRSDRRADFDWDRRPGRPWRTGSWPRAAHGGAVKDGRSPPPRGASAASVLDGAEYADHLVFTGAGRLGRVFPAEADGLDTVRASKQERPRRRSDEGAGGEWHEPGRSGGVVAVATAVATA
jgi:hypothetical protein